MRNSIWKYIGVQEKSISFKWDRVAPYTASTTMTVNLVNPCVCWLASETVKKKGIHSKQRAEIDLCVRLGKDIRETCALLREVYGKECLAKLMIQHWHKSFHDGRQEIAGLPRISWRCSSITEVNVNTMEECISNRGNYFEKQPATVLESNAHQGC